MTNSHDIVRIEPVDETKLVEDLLNKLAGASNWLLAFRIVTALKTERERHAKPEREDSAKFWASVFETWKPREGEDPKTRREQIEAELRDFHFMMEQVPLVYDHITRGRLSKPMYFASTVINEFDQLQNDEINEAIEEARKDWEDERGIASAHSSDSGTSAIETEREGERKEQQESARIVAQAISKTERS